MHKKLCTFEKEHTMTSENKKTGFATRLYEFLNRFDTSANDYIYDNIRDSTNKLRELEARIARLENPNSALREVRHQQAI